MSGSRIACFFMGWIGHWRQRIGGRRTDLSAAGQVWFEWICRCQKEKAMAPHSSTLAWKIPWTEEPGGLQSMGPRSRTWLSNFPFTFHFHALEKEMATHSSVLAWRIPGMGSHRVRHDWSDLAAVDAKNHSLVIRGLFPIHSRTIPANKSILEPVSAKCEG